MQKRSLLVGFGLGLLLAGFLSMMFNGHARWHDRYDAPVISEGGARAGDEAVYYQSSRFAHRGPGLFFPFMMMFFCFAPILFLTFMGVTFKILRRIKHRMHRRWHHAPMQGIDHHGGTPTYYV